MAIKTECLYPWGRRPVSRLTVFTYLVTVFINVHKCWVHHSRMRRSLTTAETVRLLSDSGCAAHERTKSITEIEKLGQSSRRRFYLIGAESAGVSQTDAGRPLAAAVAAWSVIHGAAAGTRRDGCPGHGSGSVIH